MALPAQLPSVASSTSTSFLSADRCSLMPRVPPEPGASTLPLLKRPSSPGLEDEAQPRASSGPALPPTPVLQVRKRGPARARALHKVTQLSVAEPAPEPLKSYGDPLMLPCPVPDRLWESKVPAGQGDEENTCHCAPVTCWEPVHPARRVPSLQALCPPIWAAVASL